MDVEFYFKFGFVWEGRCLVFGSLLFVMGVGESLVLILSFVGGGFTWNS